MQTSDEFGPTLRNDYRQALLPFAHIRKHPMSLFFFNVCNHLNAPDLEGRELPNLKIATQEAHKDILDIKRARFETIGDWAQWSIEICDERKLLLKVVPFTPH